MKLKRVVSGIQPTGILHIGNYLGAVKNWINLQEQYKNNCFYFIADNHSITTKFMKDIESEHLSLGDNSESIHDMVLKTAACLLASGIDPNKCNLFIQSEIPAHAELMWIFSCLCPLSWLNKMIQFKEKSKLNKENSCVGLYTYPILMAADILAYRGEIVPVGEDQVQHVELTRDVAKRVNKLCKKEIIPVPDYSVSKLSARIMSLQNGQKKMSKSDHNTYSCLFLLSSEEEIRNKIIKAKTDSLGNITYDPVKRPEVSNLIHLYHGIREMPIEEITKLFQDASTYEFKQELIKSLIEKLGPINYKARKLLEFEKDYVKDVLNEGKKVAIDETNRTLNEVRSHLKYFY